MQIVEIESNSSVFRFNRAKEAQPGPAPAAPPTLLMPSCVIFDSHMAI